MSNARLLYLSLAALGGFLAGLSLSEGVSLLMPFSLGLLWASTRFPLGGFVWGGVAVLVSHRWLLNLHPLDWLGIPSFLSLPISISIWLVCGFFAALLVGCWSWFVNRFDRTEIFAESFKRKIIYAIIFSIIWGLFEVLLAQWPLFWIGVGASLLPGDRVLAGLARWLGAGGLAALQLFVGWWLWQLVINLNRRNIFKRLFLIGISCLTSLHLVGWSLLQKEFSSEFISVGLWQTNIPVRDKFSKNQLIKLPNLINNALDKANQLQVNYLIAPEGTLLANQELSYPAPTKFLTGGFRWVDNSQRSSLLFFDVGESKYSKAIDKHRLVPLGEWIPDLKGLLFTGLSAVGGIQEGEPSRNLYWEGPPLAAAICYELSDGKSLTKAADNGAEWILALANLDPYPISIQREFLSIAQLRSIENARDVITVGNTGPTSLIKNSGAIEFQLQPFQEEIGLAEIHLRKNKTGYMIFGETPLVGLLIISLFCAYRLKN